MAVDVQNLSYVPTLPIKRNALIGLERLPGATKDRLQPVFLLAPWLSSIELMRSIDQISNAFPGRPYFLDIDRDYQIQRDLRPAQSQWLELQDASSQYASWLGFIDAVPNASPCLQVAGLIQSQIVQQLLAFQEMGRSFAIRIEMFRFPGNIEAVVGALNEIGSADVAIIIDAGWIPNSLTTRASILTLIQSRFGFLDAEIPIVVSYTTMPKGFEDIEGTELYAFDNREVIDDLRAATNRQRLIYGDWASTSPREYGFKNPPRPRVDLALPGGWLCARNRPEEWDYNDAASAIMDTPQWLNVDGVGVWGEFMIRQTAANPEVAINNANKNVQARVNLHLHTQAFYGDGDIRGMNLDEDWQD